MDIALFALRMVVGLTFVGHGSQKLFGAFGGPGFERTADNFDRLGLRPGRFFAFIAGSAELFGGTFLALGLLTPVAAAALIAVMTAAVLTVHLRNGFWATDNGFEFNLVMVAAAFALAGAGPGGWSFDYALNLDLSGAGWAAGALGAGLLGGIASVVSGRIFPLPAGGGRPRRAAGRGHSTTA